MTTSEPAVWLSDLNCYDVGEDTIEYIQAKKLLVSNRLDLVVKYKFVEQYDKGLNLPYLEQLYYAHLEAFTSGKFVEPGKEESKKSFQDYLSDFKNLINSIRLNGVKKEISVIPVGKNNTIINGSHRVAIAMYYNLTIPIVRYNKEASYNYVHFQKKLLSKNYLDYVATEYIRLKENVFFVCLWPKADKNKFAVADALIRESCDIVYMSKCKLGYEGLRNLMIQIYGHQDWCGNIENGYKSIQRKVDACYKENAKIILYVVDNIGLDNIVDLKAKIRNIYQIGNHSVHISDNSEESLNIAHVLLNQNSVDALNYGSLCKYMDYIASIQQFYAELKNQEVDAEDVLIDSSGVLGIYGIRKPEDIDYLTLKDFHNYEFSVRAADHSNNIAYYSLLKEELIYNPDNYLFAYGIKFCSLPVLYNMKKNRNEKKDREDCELMKPYIEKQVTYKMKIHQLMIHTKRILRNIFKRTIYRISPFLKTIHLYDTLENMYHTFKGLGK